MLEVGSAILIGLALAAVVSGIALRSLNMPARTRGPAATFPNTGNLGLPIAQLAFGDTGLAVAVAFFAVNSLVQHTLGVWVMSRSGNRSQPWPKGVMFACLLAVVLGGRRRGTCTCARKRTVGLLAGRAAYAA